jgi:hypothetical protein
MEVKEYSLKISTEQAQKNVEDLNENLKIQEDLLFDLEKELRDYEKELKKTSKTDLAARKALNDQIDKTKEQLGDERQGLKELNRERKKANEELKEAEENSADYGGVLGMVDQKTGGLISSIGGMTKSISGATKGFNLMKIAIIGTGIGALLIAITSIGAAFTSTEEGQNKFNKIMGVIGATVSVFTDRLATLGNFLISVFENPKQALIDFKNAFVENITNRISSAIDTLGFLGSAIKKVFSGDFSGAMEDAKSAGTSYIDTMTGVKDTVGKVTASVKELATEIVKEGKAAGKIADQRAAADKLDRKLITERAEADRKRAELLEKSVDKEKFSTKERIEFLKEAGRLEEEITQKEIKASKLRLSAKQAENALGGSTKEDLEEEANLKANLINLETARLGKQREITSQVIAFKSEAAAEEVAIESAKADAIESIRKALIDTDAERRQEQLNVIKLDYDEQIKLAEEYYGKDTEKVKELREAQRLALAEQQVIFDEQDATKKAEESEKAAEELALKDEEELLSFEAQRQLITDRENLLKQDKTISDADRLVLEQSFADKKVAIATAEAEAKATIQNAVLDTVSNGINVLKGLAGKNKKVQKALLIAESAASIAKIAVNTGVANAKAVAAFPLTVGQPWVTLNTINAGLGIASAVAATSKGLSALGEGGSVPKPTLPTPSTAAPTPPAESVPPAFNTVGAGDTSQLADAIGSQSQQPIQTYVVANDVTSAQSLERNIVTGATID